MDARGKRSAPLRLRGLGYYVPAIVATVAVVIAVFLADVQKRRLEEEYPRSFTTEQLGLLRSRLQGNILGDIKLVQGLVATFETEPDMAPARFADLASRIVKDANQLRSLAIAPDFVVTGVYPLQGNEASLGLNYRTNERQRAAAMRVMQENRLIVTEIREELASTDLVEPIIDSVVPPVVDPVKDPGEAVVIAPDTVDTRPAEDVITPADTTDTASVTP